jgi:hypothetical protein
VTTPPRPLTRRSVAKGVHYVAYSTPPAEYVARCVAAVIAHVDSDGSTTLMVLDPQAGVPGATSPGGQPTGPYLVVARRDQGVVVDPPTTLCTGRQHIGGTWHIPPAEETTP